ncbi:MAG TPA: VOC family protein [Candidatus Limnocylindria bacterium]|jgi:predicted enzyme related to lactoylglutathione lyase
MANVLGIGGVFFKSKDPAGLTTWYHEVLGIELQPWGGVVFTPDPMAAHPGAATIWSPFAADTDYFEPSTREFMVNLAVDDLDGILEQCRAHGVEATVLPDQPQGRFAHVLDPEGTKLELWEPKEMTA